jgi:hypothetical protein
MGSSQPSHFRAPLPGPSPLSRTSSYSNKAPAARLLTMLGSVSSYFPLLQGLKESFISKCSWASFSSGRESLLSQLVAGPSFFQAVVKTSLSLLWSFLPPFIFPPSSAWAPAFIRESKGCLHLLARGLVSSRKVRSCNN